MYKNIPCCGLNKLPAIHPGKILQEEYLAPLGFSRNALAKAIGVTTARMTTKNAA